MAARMRSFISFAFILASHVQLDAGEILASLLQRLAHELPPLLGRSLGRPRLVLIVPWFVPSAATTFAEIPASFNLSANQCDCALVSGRSATCRIRNGGMFLPLARCVTGENSRSPSFVSPKTSLSLAAGGTTPLSLSHLGKSYTTSTGTQP